MDTYQDVIETEILDTIQSKQAWTSCKDYIKDKSIPDQFGERCENCLWLREEHGYLNTEGQ